MKLQYLGFIPITIFYLCSIYMSWKYRGYNEALTWKFIFQGITLLLVIFSLIWALVSTW